MFPVTANSIDSTNSDYPAIVNAGSVVATKLNHDDIFQIYGSRLIQKQGQLYCCSRHINNDGRADIVIGAPGDYREDQITVRLGSVSAFSLHITPLSGFYIEWFAVFNTWAQKLNRVLVKWSLRVMLMAMVMPILLPAQKLDDKSGEKLPRHWQCFC